MPEKTDYVPTSPHLKEALRKIDEISDHTVYMAKFQIKTIDDLYENRKRLEAEMDKWIGIRKKLQNKIRRASPAEKEELRKEKAGITAIIAGLRKQLKFNKAIEERSVKIQESVDMIYANEFQNKAKTGDRHLKKYVELRR